jgi:CheY-like chemotaxis protein
LEQSKFDLLLTDIKLPGMSGFELATHATALAPGLAVIFSSGYADIKTDDLPFESALLPKPYELKDLQQLLSGIGNSGARDTT